MNIHKAFSDIFIIQKYFRYFLYVLLFTLQQSVSIYPGILVFILSIMFIISLIIVFLNFTFIFHEI